MKIEEPTELTSPIQLAMLAALLLPDDYKEETDAETFREGAFLAMQRAAWMLHEAIKRIQ